MTDPVRIAAAQYTIGQPDSFAAWQAKVAQWVADAARQGAQLLVFPEYAAMELAAIDSATASDLHASLRAVVALGPQIDAHYANLALRFGVTVLGGTRPHEVGDGRIVNRATLYLPDGQSGHQDKIMMTRFERESWDIKGGTRLRVFRTPLGMLGISTCYDVEFPMIARTQAIAGAKVVLCPSCTDSLQGYYRVRIGAQARALENQIFVVQAPTVGMAPWSPALDENYGAAGMFVPPDGDSPDDGVVAIGTEGQGAWVVTDADLARVERWRTQGSVRPFAHWPEQYCGAKAEDLPVEIVPLD
ncbi:MAG: carbon-nitrogen hydrolase family protein [Sphingorhabdus sp.]|uniref:carbon-nitrogen hydrolase family protein n=1 Tax=Sphingorhabdus sp. TaxID=1902408 RepID=UPI0038FC8F3A